MKANAPTHLRFGTPMPDLYIKRPAKTANMVNGWNQSPNSKKAQTFSSDGTSILVLFPATYSPSMTCR
jgi:hypothetical protein